MVRTALHYSLLAAFLVYAATRPYASIFFGDILTFNANMYKGLLNGVESLMTAEVESEVSKTLEPVTQRVPKQTILEQKELEFLNDKREFSDVLQYPEPGSGLDTIDTTASSVPELSDWMSECNSFGQSGKKPPSCNQF